MQEFHNEGIASHIGPESCGGDREVVIEALTGGGMDWVSSIENLMVRSADGFMSLGRQYWLGRQRKTRPGSAWSKTPAYVPTHLAGAASAALLGATAGSFTEAGRSLGSASMLGVRVVNPQGARRR
jgi:hypothetical protein